MENTTVEAKWELSDRIVDSYNQGIETCASEGDVVNLPVNNHGLETGALEGDAIRIPGNSSEIGARSAERLGVLTSDVVSSEDELAELIQKVTDAEMKFVAGLSQIDPIGEMAQFGNSRN